MNIRLEDATFLIKTIQGHHSITANSFKPSPNAHLYDYTHISLNENDID